MRRELGAGREMALRAAALRELSVCVVLLLVLASVCTPRPLCAQPSEASYEDKRVQLFLDSRGLIEEPQPEGKRIRYVRYERRQVLEPDDLLVPVVLPNFASTWPNVFHWLSEQSMVQREVLLHSGELFQQTLADESMRNLRDLGVFALVKVVAVRLADPHAVGVVVYTRDLWSLRLEQDFSGTGSTYTLGAQLVERNFLGRDKSLAVRGSLDPLRFSAGETYLDPRVAQKELRLYESFDVIWNRATVRPEGSTGTFEIGRPFYNLAQRTAFNLYGYYADFVARDTRAGRVVGFDTDPNAFGMGCAPGSDSCLARVWRDRQLQLEATGDYRIGERYKQTFSFGLELDDRSVAPNAETALRLDQVAIFSAQVLPRVRRDIYPFVRYRLSLPTFRVFKNLATFGQSESVQVGPRLDGYLGVPARAYGASSDGLIAHGLMAYVYGEHDALIDLSLEGYSRLESGIVDDQRAIVRLRAASPAWPAIFGRLVMRASLDAHRHDTQNTLVSLGGDNGLRGYAAQEFYGFGARQLLGNFEYRTRPWLLQSVHIGAVAFYDVGSVYRALERAKFHHDVGAGLRVLFPQFNRYVFRLDFGVPLERSGFAVLLAYGSDQVVPLTAAEDDLLDARPGLTP
jgi:hypothetical protein